MAKAQSRKPPAGNVIGTERRRSPDTEAQGISAAELMSFLKEAGGTRTWTEKDLAAALKISLPQAKDAAAVLLLSARFT
jgi:hypothetical protein